tara:strand:- start:813 stop:1193 length:381 start_codon:yes stop_codon:yes gene_type:complete
MRIIFAIALLLITNLAAAQDRENWSCEGIDLNGFSWNGSEWGRQAFSNRSWRFTFAGDASRQTINGQIVDFNCNNDPVVKQCSYHGVYFIFNTDTGKGALADVFGAALNPDDNKQMFVELVECTES